MVNEIIFCTTFLRDPQGRPVARVRGGRLNYRYGNIGNARIALEDFVDRKTGKSTHCLANSWDRAGREHQVIVMGTDTGKVKATGGYTLFHIED